MNLTLKTILLIAFVLSFSSNLHAEKLVVRLDVKTDVLTRNIPEGTIIAVGHIESKVKDKIKIILSSSMERFNESQKVFIARGLNNPKHTLLVKIGGKDWFSDELSAALQSTSLGSKTFYVYSYGDAPIPVDTYILSFYAFYQE
ncbi:hypothetical protein GEY59_21580 [Salmonella enterica subsp. enterica serovar Mikawasima]|uniref:Adhesin n=2 Tax=Salmonella enterica I TaxID=59201 RepID=A0A5I5BGJ8_SALET|nr:AfaD family invasin [Salmonella enterica]EAA1181485.1 hypothetical protein [Salmonella enterica subsp. enterica serovar Mikawasima]EAA1856099.1 hypothetical protein [Salmonella enterica subsp. enterica serovar Chester]EAA4898059.1 hypothetical protein [Salmonella enterica subsp. enterica serovar Oranienburg]EAB9989120.1 hypothetical protein [Salmonella enterica subsp. enterica serovar Eko]EBS2176305.1 hypothetical protein [Salmonella enterica subsp. enterica serovar Telelkebir]EBU8961676.1